MSRLSIPRTSREQQILDDLYREIQRRISATQQGICPADMSCAFVSLCAAQSCGKCVPCRIGLAQMRNLIRMILDGEGSYGTLELLERTARTVAASSDCVIGAQAGELVLTSVRAFKDDYQSHIDKGQCLSCGHAVPCRQMCPAKVDIPGYIALVHEGRYADAVRLIRKDNPFPAVCGLICEHPCEHRCRRNMLDEPLNIRGLKRYAVDKAGPVPPPPSGAPTGKKVAIIGGGPNGLTAAYFLRLMGHEVDVFEKRNFLGGMLRYGIPSYRLPREELQKDIDAILATGVNVRRGVDIGTDITMEQLERDYDAVHIAIGAHNSKTMRIPGEDASGVISSVMMLRDIGDNGTPDLTGKRVLIVGGGNVAMDAARSAIRFGAQDVKIIYRRRRCDMPALNEEIEGAIAEGCEVLTMMAPVAVKVNDSDEAVALVVQPQISGALDKSGRPSVRASQKPTEEIPCDLIVSAIGQAIESQYFASYGLPTKWDSIDASLECTVAGKPNIFAGGDCVTGPATVIRAIAAGKTVAANIDQYLGYNHRISVPVEIPAARIWDPVPCGRVDLSERDAAERKHDFAMMERGMSDEEAEQESNRCLRCDHFGYGVFREGRELKW